MYDETYIQESINTIFNVECDELNQNNSFHYIEKFHKPKSGSSPSEPVIHTRVVGVIRKNKKDLDLDSTDDFYLEWGTYKILKQLYNKIEKHPTNRQLFIELIKEKLLNGQYIIHEKRDFTSTKPLYFEQHDISSLAFYFLLKIGKSKDIIEIIDKTGKNDFEGLFHDIHIFMHNEPLHFNEELLNALEKFNSNNDYSIEPEFKEQFNRKINSIKYHNLKNGLIGINEEINIYKEKIIEIVSYFGFPSEMETLLLQIDEIYELPDSEPINSGMIGNLRSFFEKLTDNIAEQIKSKTGEKYPNTLETKIGNQRLYIKKHLNLSDREDEFIDSFIILLHIEGGHALVSEKKYFLMTKNIGITMAYFLLSKLTDFIDN